MEEYEAVRFVRRGGVFMGRDALAVILGLLIGLVGGDEFGRVCLLINIFGRQ